MLTQERFSKLANAVLRFRKGQAQDSDYADAIGAPSECYVDMHNHAARRLRRIFKGVSGGVEAYNRMLEERTTARYAHFSRLCVGVEDLQFHRWRRAR